MFFDIVEFAHNLRRVLVLPLPIFFQIKIVYCRIVEACAVEFLLLSFFEWGWRPFFIIVQMWLVFWVEFVTHPVVRQKADMVVFVHRNI